MVTIPGEAGKLGGEILIKRVAAVLHQDFGMTEGEVVKFVSEAAYDYFDQLRKFRELADFSEENGLYGDKKE